MQEARAVIDHADARTGKGDLVRALTADGFHIQRGDQHADGLPLPVLDADRHDGLGLAVLALSVFRTKAALEGLAEKVVRRKGLPHMLRIAPGKDHALCIQQLDIRHKVVERHEFRQFPLHGLCRRLIRFPLAGSRLQEIDDNGHAALNTQTCAQQVRHDGQLAKLRIHGKIHFLIDTLPQEMIGKRGADAREAKQPEHGGSQYAQEHFRK